MHVLTALAALTALSACADARPHDTPGQPTTVAVTGRTNDNVSIAAQASFVAITWSATTSDTTDIFLATSRDDGAHFSPPVRVNATAGDARVSGEQPPRLVLIPRAGRDPDIAVVWTTRRGNDWRLLSARSSDGGATFGASAVVPGSEGAGSRGWESIAVDSTGRVFVLWLDHRDLAAGGAMHHVGVPAAKDGVAEPAQPTDPTETAERSQLYISALDGVTPQAIERGVCYCCKTSLVFDRGDLYAVWRQVFPGSERDIAFTVSRDGGRSFQAPVRVSDDRWVFDGCPDNGPAIAIDGDRRVHVLWVTPRDARDASDLVLYHAVSSDGRHFAPRTMVATRGLPGHAQLAIAPDGRVVLAWDEIVDGGRRVMLAAAHEDAGGTVAFAPIAAVEAGEGHHPVVAPTARGVVVAWVRPGQAAGSSIGVATVGGR